MINFAALPSHSEGRAYRHPATSPNPGIALFPETGFQPGIALPGSVNALKTDDTGSGSIIDAGRAGVLRGIFR